MRQETALSLQVELMRMQLLGSGYCACSMAPGTQRRQDKNEDQDECLSPNRQEH